MTLTIFRALQTEAGITAGLNERQNRLLLDLQPEDDFTPREYQERYAAGLTPRQARRDIEELEALKGLVRERGDALDQVPAFVTADMPTAYCDGMSCR